MIPSISSYGRYSSENYGVNTLRVGLPGITLYYSYTTVVAFSTQEKFVVCDNVWSVTTGKHLNWINPCHEDRVSYEIFTEQLENALEDAFEESSE